MSGSTLPYCASHHGSDPCAVCCLSDTLRDWWEHWWAKNSNPPFSEHSLFPLHFAHYDLVSLPLSPWLVEAIERARLKWYWLQQRHCKEMPIKPRQAGEADVGTTPHYVCSHKAEVTAPWKLSRGTGCQSVFFFFQQDRPPPCSQAGPSATQEKEQRHERRPDAWRDPGRVSSSLTHRNVLSLPLKSFF